MHPVFGLSSVCRCGTRTRILALRQSSLHTRGRPRVYKRKKNRAAPTARPSLSANQVPVCRWGD